MELTYRHRISCNLLFHVYFFSVPTDYHEIATLLLHLQVIISSYFPTLSRFIHYVIPVCYWCIIDCFILLTFLLSMIHIIVYFIFLIHLYAMIFITDLIKNLKILKFKILKILKEIRLSLSICRKLS